MTNSTPAETYRLGRAGANALHIIGRHGEYCVQDRNAIHRRSTIHPGKVEFGTLAEALEALARADAPCKRCLKRAGLEIDGAR